ncbi:MAG: 16S rRNA (adenine(1518)-N(6)/adenine(1519)-N(6))-dimethyltransferase RsmA [Planctomycetota bacterium]|jgi:16S rRNA (adenine1518-N6/adenine1519-N6)-dimethyltransferase
MQTLSHIKSLLESLGMTPKHALGQNFLIDHNLLTRLVSEADLTSGDLVLEVGPGTGTLTETLLQRGCEVVACELDDGLVELLRNTLALEHPDSLRLIHGDCLESKRQINPSIVHAIVDRPFQLVANLPYQAATPLMLTLLISHPNCRSMHVTIQQEVADRILAPSGSKTYGELSIIAQALGECRRIANLPPGCFWPQPKVTSAMISIARRDPPLTEDPRQLVAMTSRLFATRRKQLGSILGRDHPLPEGVDPTRRPESLSVEQICELARLSAP